MKPFKFTKPNDDISAIKLLGVNLNAKLLAGGTNILDLMKEGVEEPDELIDIGKVNLRQIRRISGGINKSGVSIGALGKNTETANHAYIRNDFPLLSQAILAGASAQIRNMASNGGNLLQRTRCSYFYDIAMPCNKREPGTGCGAMEGINRMHAIFGWSEKCIAVYPSDMSVALSALEAFVRIKDNSGEERLIPFAEFHRLPGDTPEIENSLNRGDLITSIELPRNNFSKNSYYLKVRDRASYAFALVSVAVGLEIEGTRIIKARIAMGGVAHKPWRAFDAEKILQGAEASEANFQLAAETEMKLARPLEHNKFKVELGKRAIALALKNAMNNTRT